MKNRCLLLFLFFNYILQAQSNVIQESIDYLLKGNQDELVNIEELSEQLRIVLQHPIDVNTSNEIELQQLPLISKDDAILIINYRKNNGKIRSIYELKHIGFSPSFLELLQHYFKTEIPTEINNDILYILRFQSTFKKEKNQLGNPHKIYSRFKYSTPSVQLGFTAEKDQGESFFDKHEPTGFDFYSAYLQCHHKSYSFIVGDFTVNTAQGLVHSNSYRSIYTNSPLYANLYQNQMRVYTSTNENQFYRGFSFRKQFEYFSIQPFISFKQIDASIENDTIKSLPNTGYHRTLSELAKKDQCTELTIGNSTIYELKNLTIGLQQLYIKYSLPFVSDSSYYKKSNAIHDWQSIYSIDFSWRIRNINLFGESAIYQHQFISTINGLVISLNKTLTFSTRIRNFSSHFYNPYAATYSQSSTPRNEEGIDFSILSNFRKNEQLLLNFDIYKHRQIRYGVKGPSSGKNFSICYQKEINKKVNFYVRYQFKENRILFDKELIKTQSHSHQIRLHFNWKFKLRSTMSFRNEIHINNQSTGWLSYINIKHQIKNSPFNFYLRYTLFNISDNDARIYAYENDVQYASSIPSYSSKGRALNAILNYKLNRDWSLWLKYSLDEIKIQVLWQK